MPPLTTSRRLRTLGLLGAGAVLLTGAAAVPDVATGGAPLTAATAAVPAGTAVETVRTAPEHSAIAAVTAAPAAVRAAAVTAPRYLNGRTTPSAWWSRCTTIRYAIDTTALKGTGLSAKYERAWVKRALAQVRDETGYRFKDVGSARVVSSTTGMPVRQSKGKAAELLITFGGASGTPAGYRFPRQLEGSVVGVGGAAWSGTQIRSGFVVFDARDLARFGGARKSKAGREVYLHEVGHAMGLGHVNDGKQIMYPTARGKLSGYGSVDVKGLRTLYAKRCAA